MVDFSYLSILSLKMLFRFLIFQRIEKAENAVLQGMCIVLTHLTRHRATVYYCLKLRLNIRLYDYLNYISLGTNLIYSSLLCNTSELPRDICSGCPLD